MYENVVLYLSAFVTAQGIFLISNARLKLAENQAKTKQHPEAELLLFENYSLSSSTLSFKNNRRYSKKCRKIRCVCFNEVLSWQG